MQIKVALHWKEVGRFVCHIVAGFKWMKIQMGIVMHGLLVLPKGA